MKRGDICIALLLLAVAAAVLLLRPQGKPVVYVNGQRITASTEINGVVIELQNGKARVQSSPCRDQICVHAGWLERPGDVAVCLPQRVSVEIRSGKSAIDAVAY
ncbi:MAG: NusG domain II-containing protein [Oscillospiraceae bacterium]|jgi:hypothetical protein|nr:NusG domain II-containing protein [Oscillospiraceae bacterium]